MRVAIVTESFLPTVSGVTTSVLRVLDHLACRGHDAIVIAPAGRGPGEYRGFPVHRMPAVAYRQFPVGIPGPQMSSLLSSYRPDVVHAASPFFLGGQALSVAARLGIPSVAVFQTDMARYAARNNFGAAAASLVWKFIKRIHGPATLTLVPSSASMHDLERIGVERLARWGRGVDSVRYHPNRRFDAATRILRSEIGLAATPGGHDRRRAREEREEPEEREAREAREARDTATVVVGYVGRLAAEKEVHRLAALRHVAGIRLVIVGDGPDRRMLGRRLAHLDPVFLGALHGDALATAYAALDVFVHTGTTETFGQTLQEAHAAGLPVIAPAAGGPLDLVRHGVDGLLFDPRHEHSLRRAVTTLVGDPGLRARMGEAGRRAVLDRTWEHLGDELLGHYRAAIGARALHPSSPRLRPVA